MKDSLLFLFKESEEIPETNLNLLLLWSPPRLLRALLPLLGLAPLDPVDRELYAGGCVLSGRVRDG